jgi:hypothetical protein
MCYLRKRSLRLTCDLNFYNCFLFLTFFVTMGSCIAKFNYKYFTNLTEEIIIRRKHFDTIPKMSQNKIIFISLHLVYTVRKRPLKSASKTKLTVTVVCNGDPMPVSCYLKAGKPVMILLLYI